MPRGAIVYSDPETSFRLAAAAPVYIAVAPPGHVADTAENRPYERARDARKFVATGDLSIPRAYGAEYLVVDRLRLREPIRACRCSTAIRGSRSTGSFWRASRRRAEAAAARRLDPHDVARLEIGGHERGELHAVQEVASRLARRRRPRAPRGASARRCVRSERRQRSSTRSSRTTPSPPRKLPGSARSRAGARSARRGAGTRARAPRPAC